MNTLHALAVVLAGFASSTPAAVRMDFAGSSTIGPLIESLQPAFENAGIKARVLGGGSSVGIKTARSGMAQVGMVSRELTDEEKKDLLHVAIAKDAVAIIVNKKNPLAQFSSADIQDIYSGKRVEWASGSPITVINKEPGRATLEVFQEYFNLKGLIRKDAVVIGPNGQAIEAVAGDPNAIGYVSLGDALAAEKNGTAIRVAKLDGVMPTPKAALAGKYKLSRPLNLVFTKEKEAAVKPVMDLIFGAQGRKAILESNFIPTKR